MNLGQNDFLLALGWAVLNSLWQMAFLWVIYQTISGVFRKAKASHKSSLASLLIIVGFAWFVFTFISILFASTPDNGALATVTLGVGKYQQFNDWMTMMLPLASLIYLTLLVLPVFHFVRNYRFVRAIRQYELSKIDVSWRIFVQNTAAMMGIKKPVHVWLSGLVTSPVTIGYLKPVILLPIAALNHLSPQQTEAVLLHELAHIRRYDYLMNLIIRFIQALLYFNPFIKALMTIVEREREKSCDEMVLQFQYDPYGYASALLTLEKVNSMPKTLAVAAGGRKNDLLHRIECLLGVQKKQVISFNKMAGLFAGLLCFIAFNALLIMSRPQALEQKTVASSFTPLPSPFYFFTDNEAQPVVATRPVTNELPTKQIVNNILQAQADVNMEAGQIASATPQHDEPGHYTYTTANGTPYTYTTTNTPYEFFNVAFSQVPAMPHLKAYEEEQVKEVLQASRKVLEEKQWQAMENKLADAINSFEKRALKNAYEKEMKKVNWKKMEDKLRMAYDKIEWDRVNEELNKAITEIRIDSLQDAYTVTLAELSQLQQQLSENNLTGIPDSDISLKKVEQCQKDVQKAIKTLNNVKTKKIVHL